MNIGKKGVNNKEIKNKYSTEKKKIEEYTVISNKEKNLI